MMNASSSKTDGFKLILEEDEAVDRGPDYADEVAIPPLDFKGSLSALSQQTSYSQFGEYDISHLILQFQEEVPAPVATQPDVDEKPPDSSEPSASSLGKRKASESSSMSSVAPPKASKIPRPIPRPIQPVNPSEDDFFTSKPVEPVDPDDYVTPICLSAHHNLQPMFKNMPYGAQYEIARYVSLDKIQYNGLYVPNITKLTLIKTNGQAVPVTAKTILADQFCEEDEDSDEWKDAFAREQASKSPWVELDREEEALKTNPLGGLGFNNEGEYMNWYGGKILFHGKLQDVSVKGEKLPRFKLTLEPAELDTSNMFARRFGSKHFFRLKLTKFVLNSKNTEALMNYLCRPLILCGNVFRAFYAKETNVFYVKTNENTDGEKIMGGSLPGIMSFLDFLEWHNPMNTNNKQTMAKYVSRFALGLSNSVPGIVVDQSNIRSIDDIIAPVTGSNMTDGAGKINRWSLMQIRHRLNWEDKPTAIQTRIFGTKGLLIDDGKNAGEYAYVEVTPSQKKIQFPEGKPIDLAHRIVDVLRASHTKAPCRLSVETIVCLAENGVKKNVFLTLLQKALKDLVEPLLKWDTPEDMRILWSNVRRLGGVMAARRAREDAGLARVKGYSEKEVEEADLDEDGFDIDTSEHDSVAWWGDEVSGCPSSLEETIMCMLDAGFTPQDCPVLRDKLYKFIKGRVSNYIKGYRIDVPMSATAFLIPDTSGTLEPGEVFFKSSRRDFLNEDGSSTDIFIGEVLLTRHPCKLPTDIRKFNSVDRPHLHHLCDVIIMSTKGDRRAADLLSGGDYDGDKGTFIYQPEIVNAFKDAPLKYAEPPKDINSNFYRENLEVTKFQEQTDSIAETKKIRKLQDYLLGSVRNTSVVGKYSTFHDIATYTLGYAHDETIRLAYMFCMTLDGIKTGMTVLPDILKKDIQKFQKRPPRWKETEEERARNESLMLNETHVKRPKDSPAFIMDELHKQAEAAGKKWFPILERAFVFQRGTKLDEQLADPWNKAWALADRWKTDESSSRMANDLEIIKEHVEKIYTSHRTEMGSPRKSSRNSPKKGGASFSDLPIEVRQNKIRDLSRKFNKAPTTKEVLIAEEDIARLRASYAYVYDYEQRNQQSRGGSNNYSRFPFDMAMRELCLIKARASKGRYKAVSGDFYEHFNMKHPNQHHH